MLEVGKIRKHSDVQELCEMLKDLKKGESVSREAITTRLGVDNFQDVSSTVGATISRLRNKYGKVFKLLRGDNLKCLTDEEVVRDQSDTKKANRSAKRQLQKYSTVSRSELNLLDKSTLEANIMRAAIQETVTSDSSVPLIERAIRSSPAQLSIGQTLEIFK